MPTVPWPGSSSRKTPLRPSARSPRSTPGSMPSTRSCCAKPWPAWAPTTPRARNTSPTSWPSPRREGEARRHTCSRTCGRPRGSTTRSNLRSWAQSSTGAPWRPRCARARSSATRRRRGSTRRSRSAATPSSTPTRNCTAPRPSVRTARSGPTRPSPTWRSATGRRYAARRAPCRSSARVPPWVRGPICGRGPSSVRTARSGRSSRPRTRISVRDQRFRTFLMSATRRSAPAPTSVRRRCSSTMTGSASIGRPWATTAGWAATRCMSGR